MNYHPFKKNAKESKFYFRYPSLNMFDRTVGRHDQMGLFDYALAGIPFLVKHFRHKAEKRNAKGLTRFLNVLTVPLAMVKLALYVGTSPVIFVAWSIEKGARKSSLGHKISPYTAELNKIKVRAPDSNQLVSLSDLMEFHDSHLRKFSIKNRFHGELAIVHFPGEELFATIDPSRENIATLQRLYDPGYGSNRIEYFLSYIGKNIIDHNAHVLIEKISKQQACDRVKSMYDLLVKGTVADPNNTDTSLANVPKDVRDIIAKEVLIAEADSPNLKHGFFATFKPEEREEAVLEFISKPRHQRM